MPAFGRNKEHISWIQDALPERNSSRERKPLVVDVCRCEVELACILENAISVGIQSIRVGFVYQSGILLADHLLPSKQENKNKNVIGLVSLERHRKRASDLLGKGNWAWDHNAMGSRCPRDQTKHLFPPSLRHRQSCLRNSNTLECRCLL